MHSSRMRTARLLPVSPCMCTARGCTWFRGRGCTWSRGMYLVLEGCTWSWWGTWSHGGGGVCLVPGSTWSGGVPGPGGCTWFGGVPAQVLPPVNRMTDSCKYITLPQTSFVGGNDNYRLKFNEIAI